MGQSWILLVALLLDAAFGEPRLVWERWPHPVVLMGRLIGWCEARFNRGERRRIAGAVVMAGLGLGAWAIGLAIAAVPDFGLLEVLAVATLLAQRSLADHVRATGNALRLSLGDGRRAVARIVGRDVAAMDQPAVARAAIESAVENLSDGVIAPALWFLVAGLPGLLVYKITNTADSMIGHRTERHGEFGWAAAKLDDLLNLSPARLTALLIALVHGRLDGAALVRRDAPLHRSPNAGWPEAAMAVCLGIQLSGPRGYGGAWQDHPLVYPEGRADIGPAEVDRAVRTLWLCWGGLLALAALVALF